MLTCDIILEIEKRFKNIYKTAAPFVDSGDLWDFCMTTIRNPVNMTCIVFANDLGVAPVKSFLYIMEKEKHTPPTFRFTDQESQWLGCLMGFIFKFVLGYKKKKERCKIAKFGIGSAARFIDGPYVKFEK